MTENKRFVLYEHKGADYILENPNTHLDFIEMLGDCLDEEEIVERLNKLYEENEQLKQLITNLYNMVKCDVDNEIEVYPKTLVEYLMNILKIIGDVE